MKVQDKPVRIEPVSVRVAHGVILHRRGRSWVGGEVVAVAGDDAARLIANGAAKRVP